MKLLTGTILFIASAGLVVPVALFFMLIGSEELQERQRKLPADERLTVIEENWGPYTADSSVTRVVLVDDNLVQPPRGRTSLTCPRILNDGSLDPRHEFKWKTDGGFEITWAPMVRVSRWESNRHAPLPEADYKRRRMWTMPYIPTPYWVFSPELGIVRINKEAKVEGSLTEEGWIAGVRTPSTFAKAVFFARGMNAPHYKGGHQSTQEKVLLHLRGGSLYRADLENRKIELLGPVASDKAAFLGGRDPAFAYVPTPDRIYRVEMKPRGKWSALEVPATVAGTDYELGWTEDEGPILRAEVPGSRTPTSVRYKVAVLSSAGEVRKQYEYDFAIEGGLAFERLEWKHFDHVEMRPGPFWTEVMTRTTGGIACTALIPPAGRPAVGLVQQFFTWMFLHPRDMELQRLPVGPAWPGTVVAILLALLVGWRARPHHRTWLGPILWALFVAAFGAAGALVWCCLGGRHPVEACGKCGRRHATGFSVCPSCGAAARVPPQLGIEILRPIS